MLCNGPKHKTQLRAPPPPPGPSHASQPSTTPSDHPSRVQHDRTHVFHWALGGIRSLGGASRSLNLRGVLCFWGDFVIQFKRAAKWRGIPQGIDALLPPRFSWAVAHHAPSLRHVAFLLSLLIAPCSTPFGHPGLVGGAMRWPVIGQLRKKTPVSKNKTKTRTRKTKRMGVCLSFSCVFWPRLFLPVPSVARVSTATYGTPPHAMTTSSVCCPGGGGPSCRIVPHGCCGGPLPLC